MTQIEILSEIAREQAMRRNVWNTAPGSNKEQFISFDHQRYYDRMSALQHLVEEMTSREFKTIQDRVERRKAEAKKQTTLDF